MKVTFTFTEADTDVLEAWAYLNETTVRRHLKSALDTALEVMRDDPRVVEIIKLRKRRRSHLAAVPDPTPEPLKDREKKLEEPVDTPPPCPDA